VEFHQVHLILDGRNTYRNIEPQNQCRVPGKNKNQADQFRWKPVT